MSNSHDDIFSLLGRMFANGLLETDESTKGKSQGGKATLVLIGLLGFVGYEGVKVLFRKNFGMTRLAWVRLIICSLCFLGLGVLSVSFAFSSEKFATQVAVPAIHIATGVLFAILAVLLLVKGAKGTSRKVHEDYGGDSTLLAFLLEEGWSKKKVQNFAEPMLIFAIGSALCVINIIAGLALIFCALSVWANVAFEALFPNHTIDEDVNNMNSKHRRKANFNRART